jgi:predicted AAA+ superfamily ATPase
MMLMYLEMAAWSWSYWMNYIGRIVDAKLAKYLKVFGAVLIEGPKWCGKTWTATRHSNSFFAVADPANNFRNRELARLHLPSVLEGPKPRLIDEWQEVPSIWDAVRFEVDRQAIKGGFILTGSATPDDSATIHSGAGRIGRLPMSTMTLSELGVSSGKASLGSLLAGDAAQMSGAGNLSAEDVAKIISRGGWPGLIDAETDDVRYSTTGYIDAVAAIDLSRIDGIRRNPAKIIALMKSLARNAATYVSNETLRKDIAAYGDGTLTVQTIAEYLVLLRRVFVLTELPAWEPALKSNVRLRRATKKFLSDPSLSVAALGASHKSLLEDTKFLGNLFESLVLHDLLVYADANDAKVYHYHDGANLEVDAVIETRDGTWGAAEIKLGFYHESDAAENLLKLKKKLATSGQKPPAFLAVITGVGSMLKQREDGIWVIPIDHLGV